MSILNGSALTLYGDVGAVEFDSPGFTAKDVRDALDAHGPGDITINLNSAGGIALEGLAIYNALKAHAGRITVNVDAIAASAASLIVMAGDVINMREGALMMIHDPRAITAGTSKDHRQSADRLDLLSHQFRDIYANRTGLSAKAIGDLMAAETWFDGDLAIKKGFATSKANERAKGFARFDYALYRNTPPSLLNPAKGIVMNIEETDLDTAKPWAGRFLKIAHATGLDLAIADVNEIVETAGTFDAAKDVLIDKMSAVRNGDKPSPIGARAPTVGKAGQTFDNPEFLSQAIEGALYARMSGKPADGAARDLMGRSLLDLGVMVLQARGERVSWANKDRLAARIMMEAASPTVGLHSTFDFPTLLTGAGQRILLDSYKAAESPLKAIARRRDAADFRAISTIRLSETPMLEKVGEGAEIKYGTRTETKEGFKVETYAKIFGLTRQAIINDDLNAFSDSGRAWGQGAAQTEANLLAALFTANTGNGIDLDDEAPLYTTDRGNKSASGTIIDVTNLGLARKAIRETKGLDGVTPISVTPKHLVVGPAKETEAEQALAAIAAAQVSDVNPFSGKMNLHVEPRLTGNAWRLFADPSEAEVIVFGHLNGQSGPIIETRDGWNVLGTEFRCVLDFGCGITGWRGTYLNPGN